MHRVYGFLLIWATGLGLCQAADIRPYTLPGPLPVLAEAGWNNALLCAS